MRHILRCFYLFLYFHVIRFASSSVLGVGLVFQHPSRSLSIVRQLLARLSSRTHHGSALLSGFSLYNKINMFVTIEWPPGSNISELLLKFSCCEYGIETVDAENKKQISKRWWGALPGGWHDFNLKMASFNFIHPLDVMSP